MASTEQPDLALVAHKTWRTLEPLHAVVYFAAEAADEYSRLGIEGRDGYFAARAAPMGAVAAEVVVATFFNFNPELVHRAIPAVWARATPGELVAARLRAADRALRRILGAGAVHSSEMERAAVLARQAAMVACGDPAGRPLCAGLASLPWPSEPHLVVWHAQSILREYRGDAHVALLAAHGLNGVEALITHAAAGDVPAEVLRTTRGWTPDQWREAADALRARGWLGGDGSALSEWGATQRTTIERRTDELAVAPYASLGADLCAELRATARPWSRAAVEDLRAGIGGVSAEP